MPAVTPWSKSALILIKKSFSSPLNIFAKLHPISATRVDTRSPKH